MKKCESGKILNPTTGRCVSRSGKIGRELLAQKKRKSKSPKKSPKRKTSPKRKSPKIKSPKRKSPKKSSKKSPKRKTSPKTKSPKHKSPKRKTSKSPKHKSPKKSPKRKTSPIPSQKSFKKNSFSTMLAKKYSGSDPTGYYMSEKLDGYRALFYNGPNGGEFISRNKKPFVAPKWFLDDISSRLPVGTLLDGELYTKRGDFDGMGVVRKKVPVDSEWKKITYMVFDMPLVAKKFKERYQIMKKTLKNIPHIKVVEHIPIESVEQFNKLHKKWVDGGAEGSMLRDPDSYYENKRSNMLLKVKDFMDDEAVIEDMRFGEGRNKDVMGHLIVKWAPHAKKKYKGTFDVGSGFTDYHRKNWKKLFKKGTMITVKYFEIQKSGKPRFPIFQNIYHKV